MIFTGEKPITESRVGEHSSAEVGLKPTGPAVSSAKRPVRKGEVAHQFTPAGGKAVGLSPRTLRGGLHTAGSTIPPALSASGRQSATERGRTSGPRDVGDAAEARRDGRQSAAQVNWPAGFPDEPTTWSGSVYFTLQYPKCKGDR